MEYFRHGRRQIYGTCASAIDNITASLNISYVATKPADLEWGIRKPDGTYTGMLKDAYDKKVDIAFGPFTMDESLRRNFFLSNIFEYLEVGITSGVRDSAEPNLGILSAFDLATWTCLLVWMLGLSITIPALRHLSADGQSAAAKKRCVVGFFMWPLVSTLLGQGVVQFHTRRGSRLMLGAWLLTCLVVSTYFTSLIVAALTVRTSFAKIDSVEDLVRQPQIHPMYPAGTQLGVVLQTSISEGYGYLYKHSSVIDVVDLYRPKDIDAILNHKAVLMIGKDSAKYRLKEICPKVDGRFYISTGNVYVWNSIFVAHKDFPQDLFKELNKRVKWWVENGVPALHAYELDPPGGACFASSGSSQREGGPYASTTLRFQDLTALFFIYLAFLAVAVPIFTLEIVLGYCSCSKTWSALTESLHRALLSLVGKPSKERQVIA